MRKLIKGKENQDENRIIYVAVNSVSSNQGMVTTTAATSSTITLAHKFCTIFFCFLGQFEALNLVIGKR